MRQMSSIAIASDPRDGQQILFLSDNHETRVIPMTISVNDAHSINLALNELQTVKPLTHQLLLNFARQSDRSFERVEFDLGNDGSFCATIMIRRNNGGHGSDLLPLIANPADAVVIAIRARVPIYVSEQIIANKSFMKETEKDKIEANEFKLFIENIKASDFHGEGLSNFQ
ncbi:hypothetical protein BH10CYA1_BH10CYA1_13600 [soil metagenome]